MLFSEDQMDQSRRDADAMAEGPAAREEAENVVQAVGRHDRSGSDRDRPLYRNIVSQFVMQGVKYVLPLILVPYLTRILAPEGYAVYSYVLSFMAFAQIAIDFGFNLSGAKRIVACRASSTGFDDVVGAITQARLILIVICEIIFIVISLNIKILSDNLLYVQFAYIAVALKGLMPDFVFQGMEDMTPITTRYVISKGISTALTFVVVRSADDLLWIPVLDILSSVIALAWSALSMHRKFGIGMRRASLPVTWGYFKESAIYFVSNAAAILLSGFSTIVIGIIATDPADIAFWSLSITILSAIQALYSPIMDSLYPHMINGFDAGLISKFVRLAIPSVTAGTLLFVVLARPIILVAGGPGYLGSVDALRLLSPVLFFSFFGKLYGWPVLGALGYVKELTMSTFITAGFNIIAVIVMLMTGNTSIMVFCIVRDITEVLMFLLRYASCRKHVRAK